MKVENFFNSEVNIRFVHEMDGRSIVGVCASSQGLSSHIWFSKQQAIDFATQLVDAALELPDEPDKNA